MRRKYILKNLLVVAILVMSSGCQSTSPSNVGPDLKASGPKLVYGLGEEELTSLGSRLGFQVDALGLSAYRFTRKKLMFGVVAHISRPVQGALRANGPVYLRYYPPEGGAPLEMDVSVSQGMDIAVVEEYFRNFVNQIEVQMNRKAKR